MRGSKRRELHDQSSECTDDAIYSHRTRP
jgi:hypothetical protein